MRCLIVSTLFLVAPTGAFAQIGNPAGMTPDVRHTQPGVPAPNQPNTQDRLFVQLVGAGGLAETENGKLAETKGASTAVKAFGHRMVEDHAEANARLASLAKQSGIALPAEPDADQKAMRGRLENLPAGSFDMAYLQGQLIDHQKTAQLLQWEIAFGQDAALQRFAMDSLPTVLEHLQAVQAMLADLRGTAPQGIAGVAIREPSRKAAR
jgi:putative membrane protein